MERKLKQKTLVKVADDIKVKEITKEKLLLLKNRFIFHGSHTLFNVCKPHQARCETKKQENEQFAIYGSSCLEFALLFAFEKLPRNKFSWSADVDDNGQAYGLLKGGTYIAEDDFGYIYCFSKDKFLPTSEGSMQYVCKQEQSPVAVYKVYYKDFTDLFETEEVIITKQ